MNFALSDDHILLRDSAANFLSQETDHSALLVPGATVDAANYPENWQKVVQMGWPSLIVPEDHGGAGLGSVDLSVIVMELGRTLFSSPFAGHTFATWAMLAAGSITQQERWLPVAALGAVQLALVPPMDANQVTAKGNRLQGSHDFVVDGKSAQCLVVAAADQLGWGFYLVDTNQPGVDIQLQPWRDITRQVCRVSFDQASAEPMAHRVEVAWPNILDLIACYQAAENVGGMRQVLEDSVAYANERMAFGRPIGAYQAIKHPLAEMLGDVESANAASLFAAWALQSGDERGSSAASMAKSYSSDAYTKATHRNIQIFGAIGFTWEMKNHLYYKRARGNAELFGSARMHRNHVVNQATARIWSEPFSAEATRVA
jgi:alkylation response protein AidB-like acyl-CoA dehydrogenase